MVMLIKTESECSHDYRYNIYHGYWHRVIL